ncbi:MAG: hypothetical protein A3B04_00080 [Candidatus Portnoybacteria bacterium RIFCSPLOWO2_02_FULL_39_11]|uniref:DUF4325 domain-containing protein n=1 Tax=Candidatus Portnoybacteria bacterium RIFCSPLOWO2_02_FULL_39_11 TaxID=1802001 RepID=A0A1G2FSW1_9BACT|nr:MAG: hypothetical protein A3B04_00080 [Candidatus Portnoybacteria bacterium RIFCSPLOWO2_02_FULL_39_11]
MRIELKKFGTTLISRQAGKEALAAFQSILAQAKPDEILEIDFEGVITFSPSWGDEFLTSLLNQFGDRLVLSPSDNPSVKITIELLEKTQNKKFKQA